MCFICFKEWYFFMCFLRRINVHLPQNGWIDLQNTFQASLAFGVVFFFFHFCLFCFGYFLLSCFGISSDTKWVWRPYGHVTGRLQGLPTSSRLGQSSCPHTSLLSEIILHEKFHSTYKNGYFFIHEKQHFRYTSIARVNFSTKNILLTSFTSMKDYENVSLHLKIRS